MRFRYAMEELFQYSCEIEADNKDEADALFNAVWDDHKGDYYALLDDDRILNGQELDGYREIHCYELDDSEPHLEKLTERMGHEDLDD